MKNNGVFMTRKEQARAEWEEHFYAVWPEQIKSMSTEALQRLNEDKLSEVNAGYPDTMLWLKSSVLHEIAMR